jgi:hypothetical protein
MEEHVVWSGKGTALEVKVSITVLYIKKKQKNVFFKREKKKSALKRLRETETGVNKTVKKFT